MCRNPHNIHKYFNHALKLVRQVGGIIKKRIFEKKAFETKQENHLDLVTETDKEVETILIAGLLNSFPDHKFIGEESTASEKNSSVCLSHDPTWIIDPVDGTMNFVHGNPSVCVSVGLCIDKKPLVGIIYAPVFEFLFTAINGEGAYLNDRQICVSEVRELSQAIVYSELGRNRKPEKMKVLNDNFSNIYPRAHGFRTTGSAAYNLAMVSMGAGDSYYDFGPHAWDVAAGHVLVMEAGGVVLDPEGGPFDLLSRRLLAASSEELAKEIIENLAQYYPKRDDE